ncbi:MAG: hypothetical protein HZC41_10585 [Chloroflexi bacterium]|nr:hypothetical protein [Chloroflexota bacterium]
MTRSEGDKLLAQWDAVPTERQDYYRRVYQREVRAAGASTDDAAELDVLRRLIDAYRQQALVPVGSRWASVPERVRAAARQGKPLDAPEAHSDVTRPSGPPKALALLLLPLAGLLLFGLFALIGGSRDEADALAALTTPTETLTPTPEISPTPTPLALEQSDPVIRAGDSRRRNYYPVLLQVYPADGSAPRVFVVQERAVQTADWHFDPNPDVVSWVSGLLVRPVLGLPFSPENRDLLTTLAPGARFALQMNTGAVLDFTYRDTSQVARQDAAIFTQVEPGLALVLIGETDPEGALTETRWVVTAAYPVEQEVERLRAGELAAIIAPGESSAIIGLDDVRLMVVGTMLATPETLPADLAYALVDLEIVTDTVGLQTSGVNWTLEDAAGSRFNPDALASAQGAFGALPGNIPPNTVLTVTLGFLAQRDLTDARLLVGVGSDVTVFAVGFTLPPEPPTVEGLDVQMRRVSTDATAVYVEARVFNPQASPVALEALENWLVLGYAPLPLGPQSPPIAGELPDSVGANAAFDLALTFAYSGEPYGRLFLLGREYALHINEGG